MAGSPRVSIGLPVRNGENFLEESLESLLAQSFDDLEVVISDNASEDGTETLCRAFAAHDDRVRYLRSDTNLGAARNFNRVFERSTGVYFKWAAHDDRWHEDFLLRCVEALNSDPSAVASYCRAVDIDAGGRVLRKWPSRPRLASPRPNDRLEDVLQTANCFPIFGLIRSEALRRTRLIAPHPGGDKLLLVELALAGPFHEIPDYLFLHRQHPARYVSVAAASDRTEKLAWWDPSAAQQSFEAWRRWGQVAATVRRAPLDRVKRLRCYGAAIRYGGGHGPNWLRRRRGASRRGEADFVHQPEAG